MENAKVGFELFLDVRSLHLDCELFAVMRGRDMDLGNRSGRMRHRIERRKYLLGKRTELAARWFGGSLRMEPSESG